MKPVLILTFSMLPFALLAQTTEKSPSQLPKDIRAAVTKAEAALNAVDTKLVTPELEGLILDSDRKDALSALRKIVERLPRDEAEWRLSSQPRFLSHMKDAVLALHDFTVKTYSAFRESEHSDKRNSWVRGTRDSVVEIEKLSVAVTGQMISRIEELERRCGDVR